MQFKRLLTAGIGALGLLGTLGVGTAFAAPTNAPSAQTFNLTCEANSADINTLTCSGSLGSFTDDQGNTYALELTVTAFIASEH